MAKNGRASRVRPFPHDMYIGGVRVMLKPDELGNLVSQKTRTLDQSSPGDFNYGSENPIKERTFLWTNLYNGFGQPVAPNRERPRRYLRGERVDLSIDGQAMKGPNFEDHIETVNASAGEVRQLIVAQHGGSDVVWAICENGVYRRTSDGVWAASLTTGTSPNLAAGENPRNGVRFRGRYSGSVDGLYVSTDTGNIWEYDGSAWSQAASTEGPGDGSTTGECRYLERVSDELWAAGDYWIVKTETDPMLRVGYSAVIWIGDQSAKITAIKMIEGVLFVFKEDGIYTVDVDGIDNELFPHLRVKRSATNGYGAAVWMGEMWVSFSDQLFRLRSNGSIISDGLDLLLENTSGIKGQYVGGAGHNHWFFYEVYYDVVQNESYLVKHGTWTDENEDGGASFDRTAHHGALAIWAKRATHADIIPGLEAAGNDRLYVGFSNGTVEWCILPQHTPNPTQDNNCEFTYLDSYVYLPLHHSNFQADHKLYRGVSVPGTYLSNTEWVEVQYNADVANPTSSWVTLNPDQPKFTIPGQRLPFPTDAPVYSKNILFRIKLIKNASPASSPPQLSPVIDGIAVHEQVRPSLSLEYVITVDCSSDLVLHNGLPDRRRGVTIRDALLDIVSGPGTVSMILPSGESKTVTIVDYKDVHVPYEQSYDLAYEVQIQAIELQTLTPGTSFSGLTYLTLEQYTHGELEAIL